MSAATFPVRRRLQFWRYGFAVFWAAAATVSAQVSEIPFLTGRITDNAEILTPDSRERISEVMRIYEQNTSNQIAILTMPSLENGSIEEFSAQVLKSWKLGLKGRDNGVLVVVSPGDRRVRIEVGKGLRNSLSEEAAGRIIRESMAPRFNEGSYDEGLAEGISAIISQLGTAEPEQAASQEDQGQTKKDSSFEGPDLSISERILFGCFIFGIIGLFTVIGVVTPGVGWFLYIFLIPFWAMFPIVVVGVRGALILLVIYLIGFPATKLFLRRSEWYEKAKAQLASKGMAHLGGFTIKSGGFESSWNSGRPT